VKRENRHGDNRQVDSVTGVADLFRIVCNVGARKVIVRRLNDFVRERFECVVVFDRLDRNVDLVQLGSNA
jgi:hypothetical protein